MYRVLVAHSSRRQSPLGWFLLQSTLSISSSSSSTSSSSSSVNKPSAEKKLPKLPSSSASNDWARPKTIPFQAKVANSVNLIGYVSEPIQFQSSADQKFWASTAITQHHPSSSSSSNSPDFWIPVIFEGDLAYVAASHLKINDHVYIAGQISADPPVDVTNKAHPEVRVMVHDINFIQGSSHVKKSHEHLQKEDDFCPEQQEKELLKDSVIMVNSGDSTLNSWRDLLNNSKQWWDYRSSKLNGLVNPKHPDFKRKDGDLALWLNKAPRQILLELEKVEFDTQIPKPKQVKQHKGDEYWTDLLDNPHKWWDNRVNKRNVRGPDFKHKETGVALWLSDSPTWVIPQLPPLKSDQNQNVATGNKDIMLS